MKKIKKYIRETREIKNLNQLLQLAPTLVPSIEIITDYFYTMERCEIIKPEDFKPSSFYSLYTRLLMPLHKIKRENFTQGIYKYFMPSNLDSKVKGRYYIPYIMEKFEKITGDASSRFPELIEDVTFTNLVRYLESNIKHFEKWKPHSGYSLLHGDLPVSYTHLTLPTKA